MPETTNEPTRARDDFPRLADPFRRELLAHCYRMMGSAHDAEDLVQETYLRAWRAYDGFEGRSSLRTWLHRIATSACLSALEGRSRRLLPAGLGLPGSDPSDVLVSRPEVPWLEPLPDALSGVGEGDDPAAIVATRESVRLAFVAALQHLPPRQRAVLILRDVMRWRAAEVASMLGVTTTAVNSLLQRARAQLARVSPSEESVAEPTEARERELLDRYVAAFERKDVGAIVALFTDDVVWEMPPYTAWYQGPERIARHLESVCPARPGRTLLVPASANGQAAFGLYLRDGAGDYTGFALQVLTVTPAGVSHVANFMGPRLFETFGLPRTRPFHGRAA
ncbi:RNA polymerase sigma factor [Sphaerisporangium krabiense]|uniref:RNA polymerase sigma factor n=1 Tax=Sphaerisporangium krabiense TaxID=763782 RepID=A0A7W8ZB23_9ACTN|nr:sigma-70 family RNA polymerase sigma factor [Sphaerisporangium krabiense]MBB5630732.1 RNA polymerase sigma-70 factor (ECF subfamily) [Sphaerisporangium krabiense]GII65587.1 RNA polymerase sigma factor [Sphaerisporangium krabiense]